MSRPGPFRGTPAGGTIAGRPCSAIRWAVGAGLGAALALGAVPGGAAPVPANGGLAGIESEIRRGGEQLRLLEQRLARERDRRERERRRTESVLEKLDRLSARLALEDQRLRQLNRRVRRSEVRLGMIRGRIKGLRREQEGRKANLLLRLRSLYMSGPAGTARLLVMSRSVWEVLERWSLVTLLARYDLRLIEGYRETERRLTGLETEAKAELDRRAEFLRRQSETKRRLAVFYTRRARELEALERDRAKRLGLVRELERARDGLRDAVASRLLEREARSNARAASMGQMEGRLPWPVAGRPLPRRKGRGAGRGVRIEAPEGAPVRPVAPGEIVFADWVRGYGLLLVLRHGGGIYTVYGGAGEVYVKRGEKVKGEQVIARVGRTEALGGNSLYFEIRKGAIPMDPLRWLSPRP